MVFSMKLDTNVPTTDGSLTWNILRYSQLFASRVFSKPGKQQAMQSPRSNIGGFFPYQKGFKQVNVFA
jgi:hypothetical protein